jgi:hypothetical protein
VGVALSIYTDAPYAEHPKVASVSAGLSIAEAYAEAYEAHLVLCVSVICKTWAY